jgi:hypothetical protein
LTSITPPEAQLVQLGEDFEVFGVVPGRFQHHMVGPQRGEERVQLAHPAGVHSLASIVAVPVVIVEQHLRQHVRAGHSELERSGSQLARSGVCAGEIEGALVQLAGDHAGRPGTEAHARLRGEPRHVQAAQRGTDSAERPHEVLDHSVRVGPVDVKAGQLTFGE